MEHGEYHRDGRQTHLGIYADRYTSSVVLDADDVAGQDADVDLIAVACKSLVDGVIDYLIHQMVQTALAC